MRQTRKYRRICVAPYILNFMDWFYKINILKPGPKANYGLIGPDLVAVDHLHSRCTKSS